MNRLIKYAEYYWIKPLPLLKLWEKYSLDAKLMNRKARLIIIDETFIPSEREDVFVYADISNKNPLPSTWVRVNGSGLDELGRDVPGCYAIFVRTSTPDPETGEPIFEDYYHYTGEYNYWRIP